MPTIDTPQQASEFYSERSNSAKAVNQELGLRQSIARCLYEGQQWIGNYLSPTLTSTGMQWMRTNWHPDAKGLLATVNRIVKLVQECQAATFPDRMEFDAVPRERDTGMEASLRANVMGALANTMIDISGYTQAARTANLRRCIDGTHLICLGIRVQERVVSLRKGGTETQYDQVLRAYTADSTRLLLDPGVQELDLHQHNDVVYQEVWTVDRVRRELGLDIRDEDCATMGQLLAQEMHYNVLSQGRIYASLAMYSNTKACNVVQVHLRDDTGRFSRMLVGVKTQAKPEIQWVNWDNQETPFGGCGLPFVLLHGYRRADSMWSASDVAMLKDDQERLNTLASFFLRMVQQSAGSFKWKVPLEAMKGQDPDQFKSQFNNVHGGPIFYDAGNRDRPVPPPEIQQLPAPPSFLNETMAGYQEDMRGQVHRPDITAGAYKTHTANATFQTAATAANQVLGNRVREDINRHEWLMRVAVGTMVKLVKAESPSVLSALHLAGFDESDFSVIVQTDEYNPQCELVLRESSIRYRSKEEKERPLWDAVKAQAIDPMKLRGALASMDIAIDEDDAAMYANSQRAVTDVLLGQEWEQTPLGEFNQMFINAFTRAMFDPRAKKDPETKARLQRAIMAQEQMRLGQVQAQATAEQPPQPMPPPEPIPQEEQQEQAVPQEADLNSLLAAIQQGSTGGNVAA